MRDPNAIQVNFQRKKCSSNDECPGGAYCTPGPGGLCVADCGTGVKCSAGKYCSCNGECLSLTGGGTGGTGGTPVDTACPKDMTALTDPKTKQRVS